MGGRSKGPRVQGSKGAAAPAGSKGSAGLVWWHIALIVAAGFAVYWNSLGNPFVFDDRPTIADNPFIRSFSTFWQADKGSALTGRPIVAFTFALNYASGGLDVLGYRLVNIGLHLACGLLLYAIVRRTLALPSLRERFSAGAAAGIALAVALIWTLHPLNTEVVDYLTQRTESMMAVCYLLTMYAAVRSVQAVRGGAWQIVGVVACAAGMLCKETMVAAPLMVVLFDWVFVFRSAGEAFARRWRFYGALAATWVVLAYGVSTASREWSGGYATTFVSAWSYLLNQAEVITHYLELVIWPQRLVAYYGWSLPATVSSVLPSLVFVTICAIGAVVLFIRRPRLGFLAVWFFITLAPTSSFAPIAAEVGADRRMYVPLIGLIALVVLAARLVIERLTQPPASRAVRDSRRDGPRTAIISATLVIVVCVALGMRTVARNRDYADELRLSQTTLEAWPSGVAHSMVGLSLAKLNRHDEAARALRHAVVDYAPAGYDLGAQLFLLGQLDEAAAVLQRFVQAEPGMFTTNAAHTVLGRIRLSQHREAEAASEFALALAGPMPDPQAHALLGELLLDQQQFTAAVDHYRAYLQTAPSDAQAFGNLGIALASANRPVEAVAAFRRAAELQPGNASAHENLARMLVEAGDAPGAAAAAQQALALDPASAAAHDLLGQALVAQRRIPEAREHFLRALQIDPGFQDAREHLRRIGG